eukprot:TRINITY_DN11762_c0_g1_i1.p1 TRINITY_DN11762_c0_g1~~TRINITY_DN11762_c0_g1_i1.p1  ORF type:complete len:690 (+),score=134.60 TRINITY_DN11762_c0_g1_i1:161-2071(+)
MAQAPWSNVVPDAYKPLDYTKPSTGLSVPSFVGESGRKANSGDTSPGLLPALSPEPATGYTQVPKRRSAAVSPNYASLDLPSLDILTGATPDLLSGNTPNQLFPPVEVDAGLANQEELAHATAAWLRQACGAMDAMMALSPGTRCVNNSCPHRVMHNVASAGGVPDPQPVTVTDLASRIEACELPYVTVKAPDEHANWKMHPAELPLQPLLHYRPLHGASHRVVFLVTNQTDLLGLPRLQSALLQLQHTYAELGYGRLSAPVMPTTIIQVGEDQGMTSMADLAEELRSRLSDYGTDGVNEECNLVLLALEPDPKAGQGHQQYCQQAMHACTQGIPDRFRLVTACLALPKSLLLGTWHPSNLARLALRAYLAVGRPPSKPSAINAAAVPLRAMSLAPAQQDVSRLEVQETELKFQARLHVLHCAIVSALAQDQTARLCFTDAYGELMETVMVDASSAQGSLSQQWTIVADNCWQHAQHIARQTGLKWHLVIALDAWTGEADVAIKQAHVLDTFTCEEYAVLSVNVVTIEPDHHIRLRTSTSGVALLNEPLAPLVRRSVDTPLQAMAWHGDQTVQIRLHWRLTVSPLTGVYALEQTEEAALMFIAQAYFKLSQLQQPHGLRAQYVFQPIHLGQILSNV